MAMITKPICGIPIIFVTLKFAIWHFIYLRLGIRKVGFVMITHLLYQTPKFNKANHGGGGTS